MSLRQLLLDAEQLAELGSWRFELGSGEVEWTPGMHRIHGDERCEMQPSLEGFLSHVHADDRPAIDRLIRTLLEGPSSIPPDGLSMEYRVVRAGGEVREVRFHGRIDDGVWTGVAQDVTDLRSALRELRALQAVTLALKAWSDSGEGAVDLLRGIGEALDCPAAALWTIDRQASRLDARATWMDSAMTDTSFLEQVRETTFRVGEGLPGLAWEREEPLVIADLADQLTGRLSAAAEAVGVRSAMAVPAIDGGKPLGVLVFYGRDPIPRLDGLSQTLVVIGTQVGGFLTTRLAALGPRRLSDRELEVLRCAAEGLSVREIAERLYVSPATVKTHFEHIYAKLGVGDRTAAVAHALRIGLID